MRIAVLFFLLILLPAAEPPLIAYVQTGPPGLVAINNPEMLQAEDLVEAGKAVHRQELAAGRWRVWAQHWNRSGAPLALAMVVANPGAREIAVEVATAAPGAYAHEFVAAWNAPSPRTLRIPAGGEAALLTASAIAADKACGGVLEFACDASVVLWHLAARDPARLCSAGSEPVGYVVREWGGGRHREARVYKGANPHAVAELAIDWRFGDDDRGVLPVRWRPWDGEAQAWRDPVGGRDGWLTNLSVGHDASAVMSDMFAWSSPDWPRPIDPARRSDALGMYPNAGNWAVVYRHHGRLENHGTRARRVRLRLSGRDLHLAVQSAPDAAWRQVSIPSGDLDWFAVDVPAGGAASYDGRWVLGGPATGGLRHRVIVGEPE